MLMLHPTVCLVLWGSAVAATQIIAFSWLMAVSALLAPVVLFAARSRFLLLLRRTRWLLLSIAVIFLFATPGVFLAPDFGSLGPTREGLDQGLEHLLRLVLVLAALALLLERMPIEDLVAGFHGLLWPLGGIGVDRGRVALRLLLVLRYVERAPRGAHWRDWLEGADVPEDCDAVRISCMPLAKRDLLALFALGAIVAIAVAS